MRGAAAEGLMAADEPRSSSRILLTVPVPAFFVAIKFFLAFEAAVLVGDAFFFFFLFFSVLLFFFSFAFAFGDSFSLSLSSTSSSCESELSSVTSESSESAVLIGSSSSSSSSGFVGCALRSISFICSNMSGTRVDGESLVTWNRESDNLRLKLTGGRPRLPPRFTPVEAPTAEHSGAVSFSIRASFWRRSELFENDERGRSKFTLFLKSAEAS